jgi:hypothetical protein
MRMAGHYANSHVPLASRRLLRPQLVPKRKLDGGPPTLRANLVALDFSGFIVTGSILPTPHKNAGWQPALRISSVPLEFHRVAAKIISFQT